MRQSAKAGPRCSTSASRTSRGRGRGAHPQRGKGLPSRAVSSPGEIFLMSPRYFEGPSEGPCWGLPRPQLEQGTCSGSQTHEAAGTPGERLSPTPLGAPPARTAATSPLECRPGLPARPSAAAGKFRQALRERRLIFHPSCRLCSHRWQRRDEEGKGEATPAGQGGKKEGPNTAPPPLLRQDQVVGFASC